MGDSSWKKVKPKYPLLSLTEIAGDRMACRSNARELLDDAEALSALRHFARAYAILHAACEELTKFSVLELAGKRLAQGNPPLWKSFWQRFRSHDFKIAQLNVQLLYLLAETEDVVRRNIVETVEVLFDYGLTIRNAALYVDAGQTASAGNRVIWISALVCRCSTRRQNTRLTLLIDEDTQSTTSNSAFENRRTNQQNRMF